MAQFLQIFVCVMIFTHPSGSVPITISAVVMSPPLPAYSVETNEVSVVPVDRADVASAAPTADNSPLVQFAKSTTDLLMSTGGDLSRLYNAAVDSLTGGPAPTHGGGVFSAAGVVHLLASLLASLSSLASSLAADMFGRSPDGGDEAMVVPLLGRAVTRADLDLAETLLVDAIEVYAAWSRSEQWREAAAGVSSR